MVKRSPGGAKVCRRSRRHHRRTTWALGNNIRRSALKTMLAVLPLVALWQMLAVDAAFAPSTRAELQGDGGAENYKGVVGCIGACESLSGAGTSDSYCYWSSFGEPWRTGDGVCVNADRGVPIGQGTGTYGVIGSWDVSRVQSMKYSECAFARGAPGVARQNVPSFIPGSCPTPLFMASITSIVISPSLPILVLFLFS